MTLGFSDAGYDVVAAVDSWGAALDVFRSNISTPAFGLDLSDVDGAVSLIKPYEPDIIVGGPPCQDFSIAGNRDETAGRASLTLAFADIVSRVKPKAFEWRGSKSDINQMIGNAVPVNMAKYVANALQSHLQSKQQHK